MGSFGAALRRTREEKGISIDEIAGETRLSKRYLLALEDEAIHKLPGGTYNRAYLRSYAGYLGLDTERLVREYSLEEAHQTETGRLKPQPDILTSIGKAVESRQTTTGRGRGWNWNPDWITDRRIKMAVLTGLASIAILLIGGLLWVGLRSFLSDATSPPPTSRPTTFLPHRSRPPIRSSRCRPMKRQSCPARHHRRPWPLRQKRFAPFARRRRGRRPPPNRSPRNQSKSRWSSRPARRWQRRRRRARRRRREPPRAAVACP